mmetsp:Transcript_6676/g.11724  ORF Transcript_6676/g.11724 Transcript_6676/m.11724 type:complete len:90 (-) Transcript_6676:32-301(-)
MQRSSRLRFRSKLCEDLRNNTKLQDRDSFKMYPNGTRCLRSNLSAFCRKFFELHKSIRVEPVRTHPSSRHLENSQNQQQLELVNCSVLF